MPNHFKRIVVPTTGLKKFSLVKRILLPSRIRQAMIYGRLSSKHLHLNTRYLYFSTYANLKRKAPVRVYTYCLNGTSERSAADVMSG